MYRKYRTSSTNHSNFLKGHILHSGRQELTISICFFLQMESDSNNPGSHDECSPTSDRGIPNFHERKVIPPGMQP